MDSLWIQRRHFHSPSNLRANLGHFRQSQTVQSGVCDFHRGVISLLCSAEHRDSAGAIELIVFRIVQGVGGAFLFANGAAIITDAFPENERGQALGIKHGIRACRFFDWIDWRRSACNLQLEVHLPRERPRGYFRDQSGLTRNSKKSARSRRNQSIDIWGNVTFGVGLTLLLLAVTYGLVPYGNSPVGWGEILG